jgi:hypothetical protein
MNGKDSKGSGRGLTEVLARYLLGGTEKTHETCQDIRCTKLDSKRSSSEFESKAFTGRLTARRVEREDKEVGDDVKGRSHGLFYLSDPANAFESRV